MSLDNVSKKIIKIIGIIAILCLISVCGFVILIYINLMPLDSENEEYYSFVVETGMGKNQIIDKLKEEKIIKNSDALKIYVRLVNDNDILAGTYKLSPSMDAPTIIEYLNTGKSVENETVSITFVEGKRFPYYVSKIADNFDFSESDIYEIFTEDYLKNLINKYWFIDETILDKDLYYPLEGYIFPDTYEFKKSSTIEEIFDKMLGQMSDKLSIYENEIKLSKYSIHGLLTLASMVELEAVTAEDRLVLAGVFENRLESNWTLGSDVTTYYASKKELTQKLTMSDLNSCNKYNTRGTCVSGLPIGPICAPSYSSITAAINPEKTEYYYFVADKNNKLYFGISENDHNKNISMLRKQGLWPE